MYKIMAEMNAVVILYFQQYVLFKNFFVLNLRKKR